MHACIVSVYTYIYIYYFYIYIYMYGRSARYFKNWNMIQDPRPSKVPPALKKVSPVNIHQQKQQERLSYLHSDEHITWLRGWNGPERKTTFPLPFFSTSKGPCHPRNHVMCSSECTSAQFKGTPSDNGRHLWPYREGVLATSAASFTTRRAASSW